MNIDIFRIALRSDYTIGRMYINGVYLCDTLELPENIALGKPCIPRGTYAVHLTMSSRFHRILPQLMNVPGYEGIRIHPGNTVKDTKGCILVGWNLEKGRLNDSRVDMEMLMRNLRAANYKGEAIMLRLLWLIPYKGIAILSWTCRTS